MHHPPLVSPCHSHTSPSFMCLPIIQVPSPSCESACMACKDMSMPSSLSLYTTHHPPHSCHPPRLHHPPHLHHPCHSHTIHVIHMLSLSFTCHLHHSCTIPIVHAPSPFFYFFYFFYNDFCLLGQLPISGITIHSFTLPPSIRPSIFFNHNMGFG